MRMCCLFKDKRCLIAQFFIALPVGGSRFWTPTFESGLSKREKINTDIIFATNKLNHRTQMTRIKPFFPDENKEKLWKVFCSSPWAIQRVAPTGQMCNRFVPINILWGNHKGLPLQKPIFFLYAVYCILYSYCSILTFSFFGRATGSPLQETPIIYACVRRFLWGQFFILNSPLCTLHLSILTSHFSLLIFNSLTQRLINKQLKMKG